MNKHTRYLEIWAEFQKILDEKLDNGECGNTSTDLIAPQSAVANPLDIWWDSEPAAAIMDELETAKVELDTIGDFF